MVSLPLSTYPAVPQEVEVFTSGCCEFESLSLFGVDHRVYQTDHHSIIPSFVIVTVSAAPPSLEDSSGYISINANGGLNQQRVAVNHLLF